MSKILIVPPSNPREIDNLRFMQVTNDVHYLWQLHRHYCRPWKALVVWRKTGGEAAEHSVQVVNLDKRAFPTARSAINWQARLLSSWTLQIFSRTPSPPP